MNLLESVGFFRSNLYYIVKQGKVLWIFLFVINIDKKDCLILILFMFIYLLMVIDYKILKKLDF